MQQVDRQLLCTLRAEHKQKTSKGEAPIPCKALYVQLLHSLFKLAVLDALKDTRRA